MQSTFDPEIGQGHLLANVTAWTRVRRPGTETVATMQEDVPAIAVTAVIRIVIVIVMDIVTSAVDSHSALVRMMITTIIHMSVVNVRLTQRLVVDLDLVLLLAKSRPKSRRLSSRKSKKSDHHLLQLLTEVLAQRLQRAFRSLMMVATSMTQQSTQPCRTSLQTPQQQIASLSIKHISTCLVMSNSIMTITCRVYNP